MGFVLSMFSGVRAKHHKLHLLVLHHKTDTSKSKEIFEIESANNKSLKWKI